MTSRIKHLRGFKQFYSLHCQLHDMVGETNKLLRSKLPKLLESMTLYLANKDTESILFKPIKVGIQEAYRDFRRILDQHYRSPSASKGASSTSAVNGAPSGSSTEAGDADSVASKSAVVEDVDDDADEDIRIIACPEAEELNLLLTSIIAAVNSQNNSKENTPELNSTSTTATTATTAPPATVTAEAAAPPATDSSVSVSS